MKKVIIKLNKTLGKVYSILLSILYVIQYKKLLRLNKILIKEELPQQIHKYFKDSMGGGKKRSINRVFKEYENLWNILSPRVNDVYLLLYSSYTGYDYRIVPEDIVHNVIEPILNPTEFRSYFCDKNSYDRVLPSGSLPATIIRSVNGFYEDKEYHSIELTDGFLYELLQSYEKIIVKETTDTSSGLGVHLYIKREGVWLNKNDKSCLSLSSLKKLVGENFIIQEYKQQSEFMNSLCATSVNTIRMLMYKSTKDNKFHHIQSILRIGKDGSYLDNAHRGGASIGIEEGGILKKRLVDQYGRCYTTHNGIDFSETEYVIPNWEGILQFAEKVSESIPYHRILNLDVMLDECNNPCLIEYNIRSMSVWLYQFNNGACFGKYTSEIISYCANNKHKIKSPYNYL